MIGERPAVHDLFFGWWMCGEGLEENGYGDNLLPTGPLPYQKGSQARRHMLHMWSYHPGGVNTTRCDGSVQFETSNISLPVWQALSTRNGREVFTED